MDISPKLHEKFERTMRFNRIKLIAMVILLAVLIVVMWELSRVSRQAAAPEDASAPEEVEEAPTGPPPVDTKARTTLPERETPDFAPLTPPKQPELVPAPKEDPEKKFPGITDPKVLEQVLDQNTYLEGNPFLHMLWRVSQDTQEKLRGEAEAAVAWNSLWEKASDFRGKVLQVSGELTQMWERKLPENPTGLTKLYAYRVRAANAPPDSKGHLFDVYAIEKLKGALRYDRVTACGRFFKAMLSEGQRLEDPDFHIAVVLARAFERPTYLEQAAIPGPIVDGNRAEARPLYWLLKRARDIPFVELEAQVKAKADELKAQGRVTPTYYDFVNYPERYRGMPVAIAGELRRLLRIALPENLLDLPDVFYGQVLDDDRHIHTFYCLHVPEGIRHKDPVVLYGYFLKPWTYTGREDQQVKSPIFVAQRLRIIDYSELGSGHTLEIALAVVVGATAVVLGGFIVVSRRRDRQAADARRQRETERIRAKLHRPASESESDKR